ncbi:MAG: hypothetical protein U1F76_31845 [Candidatus Competibacteraceae bacterium]
MTLINNLVNAVSQKYPTVVATGFTTAYLGDERSLREFIVGDYLCKQIARSKGNAVLYLINDSYDPLKYGQLRIAVNKSEKLLAQFEHYCGYPIAEIPDPFDCHESYSQHFSSALLERLHRLDIYPVMLDTYQAYKNGYYDKFIKITLENYSKIQQVVAHEFDSLIIYDLLHLKCPRCQRMDTTHIHKVENSKIQLECDHCKTNKWHDSEGLQGKLSWKLDCAARWNLYQIDAEAFSKNHLMPKGTYDVSQFVSRNFFGGNAPVPVKYGTVQIDREVSYKLLEILPPVVLKNLFLKNFNRDIDITKDSVEHFCHRFDIQPGISYIDYIHKELPQQAIRSVAAGSASLLDEKLVSYGNRFAKFYYNQDHSIGLPNLQAINTVDTPIARIAYNIIVNTLTVRYEQHAQETCVRAIISLCLKDRNKVPPAVTHYIRQLLGQPRGLSLSTLLTLLPIDYLEMIQTALSFYINMNSPAGEPCDHSDSVGTSVRLRATMSKSDTWVNWITNPAGLE